MGRAFKNVCFFISLYVNMSIFKININRYNITAEGLVFIMNFEKLPCKERKRF